MSLDLIIRLALGVIVAYLLGSVPWAVIIGVRFFGVDVREHGSGNTGATNVFRTLGWKAAVPVMVLDIAKGSVAVLIATWLVPATASHVALQSAQVLSAIAAILGHSFSPWLKFRGGKGVATLAGTLIIISPLALLPAAVIWILVIALTRTVSLGSIIGALSFPVFLWLIYPKDAVLIVFAFLVATLVVWLHRKNIKSLRAGTERKLVMGRVVPPSDKGE